LQKGGKSAIILVTVVSFSRVAKAREEFEVVSKVDIEPVGSNGYRIKVICGGGRVKYHKEGEPNNLTCSAGKAHLFDTREEAQAVVDALSC